MPSPYAPYTDSTDFVANYFYNVFVTNVVALGLPTVGTKADGTPNSVWYGDEPFLPVTPAVAVVPGPEQSNYDGVGGRPVLMTFQTFVMVYFGKIQDAQSNKHQSLQLANGIKRFMNADITLGGNAIDTMCAAIDPGVGIKMGALMDTTRMTFRTRSKVTLNA
jgi:hypothetical protein